MDAYSEGEWYHAVVEEVDDAVSREGIPPGAVIRSVGKWSARDKSVEEVVEHIRLTKKRPVKIFFLISTAPNHCRRLTVRTMCEHVCVGASVRTISLGPDCGGIPAPALQTEEETAEQAEDQATDDNEQEDAQTCTIDAETGTCAKEEGVC